MIDPNLPKEHRWTHQDAVKRLVDEANFIVNCAILIEQILKIENHREKDPEYDFIGHMVYWLFVRSVYLFAGNMCDMGNKSISLINLIKGTQTYLRQFYHIGIKNYKTLKDDLNSDIEIVTALCEGVSDIRNKFVAHLAFDAEEYVSKKNLEITAGEIAEITSKLKTLIIKYGLLNDRDFAEGSKLIKQTGKLHSNIALGFLMKLYSGDLHIDWEGVKSDQTFIFEPINRIPAPLLESLKPKLLPEYQEILNSGSMNDTPTKQT